MIFYLLILNLFGLILMKADKYKAVHHKWRIKELTLFIVALLGGSLGILIGMHIYHHKTKKWHFILGIPLILVIQLVIFIYLKKYLIC